MLREKGIEVTTRVRGHRKELVMEYMRSNPEEAYTQSEVAQAVSTGDFQMKPQQSRQILMALIKDARVERRELDDGDRRRIYYHWVGGTKRKRSRKKSTKKQPTPELVEA